MVKILDCTLRDGSHVNNNDFSKECILDTIKTAEECAIDYVEVGYKVPDCIKNSSAKLVVMVDAKNIPESKKFVNQKDELFNRMGINEICPKQQNNTVLSPYCPIAISPVFVRVACYPEQLLTAIDAVENFKEKGFGVFLHLMTADKFSDYEILKNWKNKDILEAIYFADTFGAFLPDDVERIFKKLQDIGFEKISFHAHNNLQLAFSNTIKAIELGAYSVDASVFGMGRGAGNLPVELLLKYLNKDNSKYLDLIKKYYIDMHDKYNWGYNYETLIGGLKNIHPSKVKAIV